MRTVTSGRFPPQRMQNCNYCSVVKNKKVATPRKDLSIALSLVRDLLEAGAVDELGLYDAMEGFHYRRAMSRSALLNYNRLHPEKTELYLCNGVWTLVMLRLPADPSICPGSRQTNIGNPNSPSQLQLQSRSRDLHKHLPNASSARSRLIAVRS